MSRLIVWLGMILVAILAIPIGILVILTSLIGSCTEQAVAWFNNRN